jgi:hypothetical protein
MLLLIKLVFRKLKLSAEDRLHSSRRGKRYGTDQSLNKGFRMKRIQFKRSSKIEANANQGFLVQEVAVTGYALFHCSTLGGIFWKVAPICQGDAIHHRSIIEAESIEEVIGILQVEKL